MRPLCLLGPPCLGKPVLAGHPPCQAHPSGQPGHEAVVRGDHRSDPIFDPEDDGNHAGGAGVEPPGGQVAQAGSHHGQHDRHQHHAVQAAGEQFGGGRRRDEHRHHEHGTHRIETRDGGDRGGGQQTHGQRRHREAGGPRRRGIEGGEHLKLPGGGGRDRQTNKRDRTGGEGPWHGQAGKRDGVEGQKGELPVKHARRIEVRAGRRHGDDHHTDRKQRGEHDTRPRVFGRATGGPQRLRQPDGE